MFQKAIPVWKRFSAEDERMNCQLCFVEQLSSLNGVKISITAADFYRLTVNGNFVGFGPARTAKGYARVDEYDLSAFETTNEKNEILIEVAGYFCNSLATVRQASFLVAELTCKGKVLKYTGRDFSAYHNAKRVREVERFSIQRHFCEVWDERIETLLDDRFAVAVEPVLPAPSYLPRSVPYARCVTGEIDGYISRGVFYESPEGLCGKPNAYSFSPQSEPEWGWFAPDRIADKPYRFIKSRRLTQLADSGAFPVRVTAGEWLMVDCRQIEVGFLRWSGNAERETDLIVAFTELCENDAFAFTKINMQPVIEYHLPAGKAVSAESFEPYSFRQIAFFVKEGELTLECVGYRSFERDMSAAIKRDIQQPKLREIYRAAMRTFAHNAVDIFTDCPSRECAGWLCDSFFTGRAEYFFFEETPIEDAYLENYRLYQNEGEFPRGVLPMCYPSDPHQNNKFIPQWDMWYVLEVCEYLTVRHPERDRKDFQSSVFGILDFLATHENHLGLLERLPSWNFIEWSDANSWGWDINYPTNMLYAGLLEAVANTFDRPELRTKADAIRQTVKEMAFDGELFVDNAIRNEDGTYTNTKNVSEAGQYYAVLFGDVDLDMPQYAKLKTLIFDDFRSLVPGDRFFCPKNAFIGFYLRMNVLLELGDARLMRESVLSFCGGMADETGTLWEYKQRKGSYDHGFASYVALAIPAADSITE